MAVPACSGHRRRIVGHDALTSRSSMPGTGARPRSRPGSGRLGRIGQDAQGHRAGHAALEVVQDIDPGRLLAVQGGDPDPDLAVEPGGRALPLVQGRLVAGRDVVQGDEDLLPGLLGERGQRAVPALPAKGDPPAGSQPVPRCGECGQRRAIWWGSRLLPYAAYSTTGGYRVRRHWGRWKNRAMTRVVIIGGGPGGYEAALVGSQLGGEVTLIDSDGLGGSAVLTDCVPSKTLIATAEVMTEVTSRPCSGCGSATGRCPIRGRGPRRPGGGEPAGAGAGPAAVR